MLCIINPRPTVSTPFLDHSPSPSVYWLPPHLPPLYWDAPLFTTYSTPSSGMGPPVNLDKGPILPDSTNRTCAQCIYALDLLSRSLLAPADPRGEPVSDDLSPIQSPPFQFPQYCKRPCHPLWVIPSRFRPSSAIHWTTPLIYRPRPTVQSLLVPRRVVPSVLASCHPPLSFLLTRSVPPFLLVSYGSFCFLGALLRVYKMPGRLHSLEISRPALVPAQLSRAGATKWDVGCLFLDGPL